MTRVALQPKEESVELVLAKYDPGKYNLLMPTTTLRRLTPFHQIRTEEVSIDPDPTHGEVYKVGESWDPNSRQRVDLYALAKPALMRIAAAAGIVWNWRESGITYRDETTVVYKAIGAIRTASGEMIPISETKEIDLAVIEDETRLQYESKVESLIRDGGLSYEDSKRYKSQWKKITDKEGQQRNVCFLDASERDRWVEDHVRSVMLQWRKNKVMRAETGAIERVIRALMGLKSHYTREQLERPFVLARVDFAPDYTDPEVRRYMLEAGARAQTDVFGPPRDLPGENRKALTTGGPAEQPRAYTPQNGSGETIDVRPAPATPDLPDDLPADLTDDLPMGELDEAAAGEDRPQPQEPKRGRDGQGEWVECQGAGCESKIRPVPGKTVDDIIGYCTKRFGKVLCRKCIAQAQSGGLFS